MRLMMCLSDGRAMHQSRCHKIVRVGYSAVTAALLVAGAAAAQDDHIRPATGARTVVPLMDNWRHATGEFDSAEVIEFDDSSWASVTLPHSYNAIDGADGGGFYRGIAWYRSKIDVPRELVGKQFWLQFEGVSFTADVYIDGNRVGPQHRGGFSTFSYDVTNHLKPGSHVLAVKVDNSQSLEKEMPPQAGDYTRAGGIYRDVQLIAVNPVHVAITQDLADVTFPVASPGVYWTTTDVSPDSAKVGVKIVLDNQSNAPRMVDVVSLVTDRDGVVAMKKQTTCTLGAEEVGLVCDQTGTVDRPHLWDARIDPYLYDADVQVRDHETGELLDVVHQRLGIRFFSVDPQLGFILNGKPYALNGVNAHQDRLGKGWARSDADLRHDVDLMLELGATMVRTSHYPANQAFYNYADETGLLVYTEVPVNSTSTGGKVPTGSEFLNAARHQLRELIRQNYNHPSIVMWGLYNEISSNPATTKLIANLQALAKQEECALGNLDPTEGPMRRTTAASWGGFDQLASTTDTVGFNKYFGWYAAMPAEDGLVRSLDAMHREHPKNPIGISEYGGGANIHQHEEMDPVRFAVAPREHKSSGPWHSETRQNWIHEEWWKALEPRNYLCYRLIWQMFDSASDGRSEGSQPGINDKGLVTADRSVKKDAYYFYKANWNDTSRPWANEPTLHIADRRWTNRTADLIQVRMYTNLNKPALSLNGRKLGQLSPLGMNTYAMEVTLAEGDNVVEVTAEQDGQRYSDKVAWTYRPNHRAATAKSATFEAPSQQAIDARHNVP